MSAAAPRAAHELTAGVRAPRPLLPPERERSLSERQREILDELEALAVEDGFAELTMAQLAARVNCSLRTLYELAPRKEQLLLTVIDRRLHRIGRAAIAAIGAQPDALAALRAYLEAATIAVGPTTESFARKLADLPGATRLVAEHGEYVIAVTRRLLERARAEGRIPDVDPEALAMVLGGLGGFFSRPEILPRIAASPKQTADAILEIVLRGLESGTRTQPRRGVQ